MPDPIERVINLALVLARAKKPITAEDIREQADGYPGASGQTDASFKRMFERDKRMLVDAGFVIEADAEGRYMLDATATFAPHIHLSAGDRIFLGSIGTTLRDDPSFPFGAALGTALSKISTAVEDPALAPPRRDANFDDETAAASLLFDAILARKRVLSTTPGANGQHRRRNVEPWGVYLFAGRWYLVAWDVDISARRTFSVRLVESLSVNSGSPRTPDFEIPEDFTISSHVRLPFQFGEEDLDVRIAIAPGQAWRAEYLTAGSGSLDVTPDGGRLWSTTARSRSRLARWVIENGPGVSVLHPEEIGREIAEGLRRVVQMHRGVKP
ncbi:MAG: WYL domain-containing protein [Actinobacteria bacterium]|nr:WYL domain-containing protein [Actinomycetota bacterium]